MRRSAGGIEPPTFQLEVTANSLPAKLRLVRKPDADDGFEPWHLRALPEVAAFSLPSKGIGGESRERVYDIPPPDRCRSGQGLNLQLSSFDERVFRSNRTLTASEISSGRNQAKFPGALPAFHFRDRPALVFAAVVCRPGTGFDFERSIFTFTAQKKFREKIRRGVLLKQSDVACANGRRSSPLEPFQRAA